MAKTAKGTSKADASAEDDSKTTNAAIEQPTPEQIAVRAYHIYLERGGTDGDPLEDWLQAERELNEGRSS